MKVKLFLRRLFFFLLTFELLLVFGDVFLNEFEWISNRSLRRSFNITREDSIPNWFSSMQALLLGLTLFGIAYLARKKDRLGWVILGSFFTFVSIDDGSKLHERIGGAFKDWLVEINPESVFVQSYGWQIVLGPFLVLITLYMLWFLWDRLKKEDLRMFILAVGILAFAVGLDFFEGFDLEGMTSHNVKHTLKVIEEFLEMFATTILFVLFMKVLLTSKRLKLS